MPTQHAPSENLHPTGSLTGRLVGARRRVVYALEGDLDQASAAALANRLAALSGGTVGDIVLDLSGLEFLDSVGLEVLMRMHRRLRDDRRRLVVLDPAPPSRGCWS